MALKYLTGNYANTFQLMRSLAPRTNTASQEATTNLTQVQECNLDYYSKLLFYLIASSICYPNSCKF